MSKGQGIVISGDPSGNFREGIISGTPKPGTVMELMTTAPVNGRFTWRVFSAASGTRQIVAVLREDEEQGSDMTTAYVSGARGFLYVPQAGDELNMLVADVSGTGDTHTIADYMMVQTATGKLIVNSSGNSTPFILMETVAAPVADTILWTMFTGY